MCVSVHARPHKHTCACKQLLFEANQLYCGLPRARAPAWEHLLYIFHFFPVLSNLVHKLRFLVASWLSDDKPPYFVPILSGPEGH